MRVMLCLAASLCAGFCATPLFAAVDGASTPPPIRIGVETDAEPLSFAGADGRPAGFVVELVEAVARERDIEVAFDFRPWPELLADFQAGKIDALANMAYSPERNQHAEFAISHLILEAAIFVRKGDARIRTLADLNGRRIAAMPQGYSYEIAIEHGWTAQMVLVPDLAEALLALENGRCDFVIATKTVARKAIRDLRLRRVQMSPLALEDMKFQYHMAVSEGDVLLYDLNAGLIAIRENGVYDRLYEKWIGPLEPRTLRWRDLGPYGLPAGLVLLALGGAFWFQRRLLRRLRTQTEELRLGEERLTLVMEGSQDAFWDWDVVTGRMDRSERWGRILGCRTDEIAPAADALDPLIHPDDLAGVQQARTQSLAQGSAVAEYRVKDRSGEWHWILDRGKVVARGSNGQPTRVAGAATDISARKHAEEALARSQALLQQSQRAAEIGGWSYQVDTGALYWTEQSYRIHDIDSDVEPVTIERVFDFYTPSHRPVIEQAFRRAVDEGVSFDLELELVTTKSRLIWVRTIGRAEKSGDRVVRLYGSFQDVTDRKKSDEERQKLQLKMLEAQKLESLGVLAGGIAHDFNNLLTVILGNASLAREEPAAAAESLQHIEAAAHRAADLCRQMLAYAGKSRATLENFDLNTVVADTLQLLKLSISKNATLELALFPKALLIKADSSQIRQVVMNLVINASDAIGTSSGRIRIATSFRDVSAEQLREARLGQDLRPGSYIAFEVQDDGAGMSPETMTRIFDPFFTTKFAGRGLGLAAVLGIARAHHGAFFVRSTLGAGSTFTLLLPPAETDSTGARLTVSPGSPRATLPASAKFLVVDDEPSVRKLAGTVLERQGCSVALASDGYEALAIALAPDTKFTAILLDLTMPGLDGAETLRELRTMHPTAPVLLMSGYSEADVRRHFVGDAYVAFLPKPFSADDLLARLRDLLTQTGSV